VSKQNIIIAVLVVLVALGVALKFLSTRKGVSEAPPEAPVAGAPQPKTEEKAKPYQAVAQPVLKVDQAEKKRILKAQAIFGAPKAQEKKN
jgi:hypothetical protein